VNIKDEIINAVQNIVKNSQYTRDNLLCFAVSGQPHFLVWSSALALHEQSGEKTKKVALSNAKEEVFGLMDEGSHAPLSLSFFKQIGKFETRHYERAEKEVWEFYKNVKNKNILLTAITCIELWSSEAMKKICAAMEEFGAKDFFYIQVHECADNPEDGHSTSFLDALTLENPSSEELSKGTSLFQNLFNKIFN
jgi:hypothetical protein